MNLWGKSRFAAHRATLAVALIAVCGCEGKHRNYSLGLLPGDAGVDDQKAAGNTRPEEPGASLPDPSPSAYSSEGQMAPVAIDDSSPPRAENRCPGGDAGSCPPTSLCSPDAGAVCEATCPGCLIEGECVGVDTLHPDTICRICDPERNPREWSPNDGAACDDGLYCTVDDVCTASACHGAPRVCEDGVACNGISTCNEMGRSCSPDVNGCGSNALCSIQTDSCVSTCTGCVIEGVCLASGTEASGNPCLVCDPTRSVAAFSAATGKNCGAAPTACSQQDTCDVQGRCQPNHLPATTPCGSAASGSCDQPDACDGNGNCQQRLRQNGTPCNDGAFCTVGDQCQGGECVPTANQNCGANRSCNEANDQCQCQGCQVANTCIAAGAVNPSNPCQVCDLNRSATAFSANVGAQCGSSATDCSGQDTCNAQGQCTANNFTDGTSCNSLPGGSCQGGSCVAARQQDGTACTVASQCVSGFCRLWFQDLDSDSHGDPSQREMLCSPNPANDQITAQASGQRIAVLVANGRRFSSVGDDCCDAALAAAGSIFPGNTNLLTIGQTACRNLDPFDYDCSGTLTDSFGNGTTRNPGCDSRCDAELWVEPIPACGQFGQSQRCTLSNGSCTLGAPSNSLRACR
jgi:hypothetical protein